MKYFIFLKYTHINISILIFSIFSYFFVSLKKINFKILCYSITLLFDLKRIAHRSIEPPPFFFFNSKTDLVLREHCRHTRIIYHFVFLILLDFSFYHSSFTVLRLYATFYKSIDLFIQICYFLMNHCCIRCTVYICNAYPIQILLRFFIYFIFFFNIQKKILKY